MNAARHLTWAEYFFEIAQLVAKRSTCLRRKVGAVAVLNKRIVATGYNGAPSGLRHCLEAGCVREELKVPAGERHELCRAVHAEQNLIIQAATGGNSLQNCTIFCTTFPCSICMKMLINCKVHEICYLSGYPDPLSMKLINETNIKLFNAGAYYDTDHRLA